MKVLNFGSLNIDYVYDVDHFVRAGETIASENLSLFCGGKGLNQSVAFSKAGAKTYHAGCIGTEGEMLRQMLINSGVNTDYVTTLPDVSCGHAIIQVSRVGENCIMLYGGANQRITDEMVDTVLASFGEGDWLILQNEINDPARIVRKAFEKKMTIVLNPSPFNKVIDEIDISLLSWIIINETEGCELTGKTEPEEIIGTLQARYPNLKIVLTLGKQGAICAIGDERCSHGIFPVKPVDTTAAGDTFTGFFFTALMNGSTPSRALAVASAASSITVSRKGAAPSIPTMDEVLQSGFLN